MWELEVKKPELCDDVCVFITSRISRRCSSIVSAWSCGAALSDGRAGNVPHSLRKVAARARAGSARGNDTFSRKISICRSGVPGTTMWC